MAEADDDFLVRRRARGCRLRPRRACRSGCWISNATSLAPPCFGPRSAPIAPVIAEYMSEPVPAITRAVNVEALNSCSAYRLSEVCIARTHARRTAAAVQQMQEVPADRVVVGLDVDAPCRCATEVIPVQQHRAEATRSAGRRCRARRRRCGRPSRAARSRAPSTPVRITSIGCVAGGHLLEHRPHRRRAGRAAPSASPCTPRARRGSAACRGSAGTRSPRTRSVSAMSRMS